MLVTSSPPDIIELKVVENKFWFKIRFCITKNISIKQVHLFDLSSLNVFLQFEA